MGKVLIIDDEPAIVMLVEKVLTSRGHTVITGKDGMEAIDLARRDKPDVMVCDVNLPRIDGLSVCRTLKAEEATKDIRIILITAAYTTVEDAHAGESCGADEYVIKPFLTEVLVHNVERFLPSE